METAIVFLYLFALLTCSAASYGLYICIASLFSPDIAAKMNGTRTINLIVLVILIGGLSSFMFLGTTLGVFGLVYRLGQRYHASPLDQFIARLPGVRLIPHMHWDIGYLQGSFFALNLASIWKDSLSGKVSLSISFNDLYLLNSGSHSRQNAAESRSVVRHDSGVHVLHGYIAGLVFNLHKLGKRQAVVLAIGIFFNIPFYSASDHGTWCWTSSICIQRYGGLFFGTLEGLYSRGRNVQYTCRTAHRAGIVIEFLETMRHVHLEKSWKSWL